MPARRLKLVYPPGLVDEPILYELIRKFGLVTSVRRAEVNEEGGWLLVDVRDEDAVISQAIDWLRHLGVEVQEEAG